MERLPWPKKRRVEPAFGYSGGVSWTSVASMILSAVYAYVAAYFLMLHHMRPHDREYLHFGLFVALLSLATASNSALFSLAPGTERAEWAMRLSVASIVLSSLAFVYFMQSLVARPWHRIPSLAAGWCGVTALLVLLGLTTDTDRTHLAALGTEHYPLIPFTPFGGSLLAGCTALSGAATLRTMTSDVHDEEARLVAVGSIPAVLTAGHDVLFGLGLLDTFFLFQYGALFFVAAMGHLLLGRFVRTRRDLERRTEEIHHRLEEQRKAQRALLRKEQLAAVGRLSSMIAHEVRNPLAVLQSAIGSLSRPTLKAAYRETLLDIVLEESQRLSRLADDLVAYADPRRKAARAFDPAELVRKVVREAMQAHTSAHVEVHLELGDAPARMEGDEEAIARALYNLVENALLAMTNGGALHVEARTEDDGEWVGFVVRDTGEGMDTLVRARARDPFFSTRPAGTGLGLAIVERVVQGHGGSIAFQSRYGEGTTVTVRLPIRLEPIP